MLVNTAAHWQQARLKQWVPCLPASPPRASWVEPPEFRSPFHSLLLLILHTTPRPPLSCYSPALSTPLCQSYHHRDALLCLGLVWTCNRSITLHFTESPTQQPLEWKSRRRGQGKGETQTERERCHREEEEGLSFPAAEVFTCPIEEGPSHTHTHTCYIRSQGSPCVEKRQPGLCSWDWWRWRWFFSAPWVTAMLSSSPRREGRDGVSSLLLRLFSSPLTLSLALLAFVSVVWLTVVDVS